jgi:dipeptidyl aminopeptidase/acylaminoacyl peptidase
MATFERESFTYPSLNETVAGDLYLPTASQGPFPVVITGPGFAGVKEMLIPTYCHSLAAAGIACLAVDFIGFGASSGKPRQDIRPFDQIQTMKDGLTALENDPRFDSNRLGVWGTSLGGAHSLVLAADDARVKAAVAIIPHISVVTSMMDHVRLFIPIVTDLVFRFFGYPPITLAVAGNPGDRAVMTTDGALDWIEQVTKDAPNYRNSVTLASLLQMVQYSTVSYAKRIKIPLLAITAKDDGITPAYRIHDALEGVEGVEFKDFPGSHFGLFGEYRDTTAELTTEWFKKYLL